MKKGLWVLTILGVVAGIAHLQLTAQEASPRRQFISTVDSASPTASVVPASPGATAPAQGGLSVADVPERPSSEALGAEPFAPEPRGEQPASKTPRKELTAPEMRHFLKSWHAEEIDQLNHEAIRKRFEEERGRREEALLTARLDVMEKELLAIARAYPSSKNGKRAERAYQSLIKADDSPPPRPAQESRLESSQKNNPEKPAPPFVSPILLE
ncbi:hypothetical protein [Planctomyces sp. SH-PL14]|uniref:hypothetical protein n=1 Tax=Planctomyces sp. SH-PL14 TaxID=1632864 RepID=UPI00078C110A|nr:hypothetical protein [Planctomyces sp. SH-PL14]AMV22462.1 hypothetical protein VT03_31495 [Planctomyces sp. SH-PL14]